MKQQPEDPLRGLGRLLRQDGRPAAEKKSLARLIELFARLPLPEQSEGLFPDYAGHRQQLLESLRGSRFEALEECLLRLYEYLHGYQVPLTTEERQRFRALGGYLCHVGGLSPLLKAAPFIGRQTVSGDFGAGNGLQGLLLQYLYPHQKTVQIEISSQLVEVGRSLQRWLGIAESRVEWVVGDIMEVSAAEMDFIYLYRPVKPNGPGRAFYRKLASELAASSRPQVVFSIADCLKEFLGESFEIFYSDGHLTCFHKR